MPNNATVDMVNHPNHYKSESGLEVIDVIKAFTADMKGYQAVATANIVKYILRCNKKNGLEDLKKARWYLEDLISYMDHKTERNYIPDPEIKALKDLMDKEESGLLGGE